MCILPSMDACMSCKSPLHFFWAFLNRDSFIHEFYNLPLDITPTSLLKALLDIACPCVIFTVNSSNATGAIAVQLHACKRSAACRGDTIFNSFGPIFISLLSAQVPRECCLRGANAPISEGGKFDFCCQLAVVFLADLRAAPTTLNHIINADWFECGATV